MTVSVRISVFYGSDTIVSKLNQLAVPFTKGIISITFEVIEGTMEWREITQVLNEESANPLRNEQFYFGCIYTPHYTTKELMAAKYHFVRSTFECVNPENEDEILKGRCCIGIKTRGDYTANRQSFPVYQHWEFEGQAIVSRRPIWKKKRCFATGCFQLFCNDHAKAVIEDNKLTGVQFEPVLNSSMKPWADFWRLVPQSVDGCLVPGMHERIRQCPVCGADLFERTTGISTIQIDETRLPCSLDFFCTPSVILTASGISYSRLIISQNAYMVLKNAELTQALVFDPIPQANPDY